MKGEREPDATIETKRSPSRRTLRGLDWLNFLLADVQTGVGPFLAIYLAGYKWDEERVGLALTVGGIREFSRRHRLARSLTSSDRSERWSGRP
jgi:hypothetical protein